MAYRLLEGGALIDRSKPVSFTFDGKRYSGYAGDNLASALLANGVMLMGRSYKYHRPRGVLSSGPEEPNALMNIGVGAKHEPNMRAPQVSIKEGMVAASQNRFPSLSFDIGAVTGFLSRFFPAGFYYKTFIRPRAAWKHLYEPFIRQAAGLGRAPTLADEDEYEHAYAFFDVVIAGGGVAGLVAARQAVSAGKTVLLAEQSERFGGRSLTDTATIQGLPAQVWFERELAWLEASGLAKVALRSTVVAAYDHGYTLVYRLVETEEGIKPRHRLWRIRAGEVISATGAIERPIPFANNDLPGVMLASAVRDYVHLWGVTPGQRVLVVTNNDDAYRTALMLHKVGVDVPAIVDAREKVDTVLVNEAIDAGIPVFSGWAVSYTLGNKRLVGAMIASLDSPNEVHRISCDCLAMSGGWSPVVHLYSHSGGKVVWDETRSMYRPDPAHPPLGADGKPFVRMVGGANGALELGDVIADVGQTQVGTEVIQEGAVKPLWFSPTSKKYVEGNKHFLDFQHDVTVADIRLAAREGYRSVEHAKRYTTLGMATDQGKVSNINGHAILAHALDISIPEVGTTTFRPPYTPISFGSIAGSKARELFKPVRQTVCHDWLDERGADWEPVGDWRRPYRMKQGSEDRHASVEREILGTRQRVGLLDASTLGKIIVKGPDAGKFLDLIYTNMMSSLKVGRCRYGLMCNDNGFLFDDGVVARLGDDTFLCHTTSGGSDRVHAWLEEWLQTEWFDFEVYTTNVTEQWAQFAIAGPKAREVLNALSPDVDISAEALPFMSFVDGVLSGCPVRIFRISFSGELSYEVATPASFGLSLWCELNEAGAKFGAEVYGTEALHVMRAEKGFIMIGDETDGTVTPLDLDLGWAVSRKKDDFIGKRAMMRSHLQDQDRPQLVGLFTEDPQTVLPDGAYAVEEVLPKPPMKMIGQVTSTYYSPTLRRSIAMAIIKGGSRRMGETLNFPVKVGGRFKVIRAKVVDPVFYDKEGAKQNV